MLLRLDIPLSSAQTIRGLQSYLAAQLAGGAEIPNLGPQQIRGLVNAAFNIKEISAATGVRTLVYTTAQGGQQTRYLLPGLRGLFGSKSVITRTLEIVKQALT